MSNPTDEGEDDVCAHCGVMRIEHHAFVEQRRPAGCKCEENDWRGAIPPACGGYIDGANAPDIGPGLCGMCSHPENCHAAAAEKGAGNG
jgi:hypothetical protein